MLQVLCLAMCFDRGPTSRALSGQLLKATHSGRVFNFSDTSSLKFKRTKGSIGHAFTVCIRTENQNQVSFYPFVLHEISVLIELTLGHLCYRLTDVPPQPNSPPDDVSRVDHRVKRIDARIRHFRDWLLRNEISKTTLRVVVFHRWLPSHLFYTS